VERQPLCIEAHLRVRTIAASKISRIQQKEAP
jgi:hypothetical protein